MNVCRLSAESNEFYPNPDGLIVSLDRLINARRKSSRLVYTPKLPETERYLHRVSSMWEDTDMPVRPISAFRNCNYSREVLFQSFSKLIHSRKRCEYLCSVC